MPQVEISPFATLPSGEEVKTIVVSNATITLKLMDFGATLMSVEVPDRSGKTDNVVLSHNSAEAWLNNAPCFGGVCGRFGNRIARGRFTIDGTKYQLATNNGPNHLHGGIAGFHKRLWSAEPTADGVRFTYVSADGEEGYPGELTATVTYSLPEDNELRMQYSAKTTKTTPINLTNHAYWNLRGTSSSGVSVADQELQLFCDKYLPVDETVIPTGEFADVAGTVMDFTSQHPIGDKLNEVEGGGYDHCYVINGERGTLRPAASAFDPVSGRVMEVSTTEPGVQLYTGNFLAGSDETGGFSKHQAFCLETQTFPNAPNEPNFSPLGILNPGEEYTQTTIHCFSTR